MINDLIVTEAQTELFALVLILLALLITISISRKDD